MRMRNRGLGVDGDPCLSQLMFVKKDGLILLFTVVLRSGHLSAGKEFWSRAGGGW